MRRLVVPIGVLAIATLGAAALVGCTSAGDPTTTSSTTTTAEPEYTRSNVTLLGGLVGPTSPDACYWDETTPVHIEGPSGVWGHTVVGPGTIEKGPQEDRRMQVCRHHVVFDGFPIPEDAFVVVDGFRYPRTPPADPAEDDCGRWVKHFLYSNDYFLDTTSVCDI